MCMSVCCVVGVERRMKLSQVVVNVGSVLGNEATFSSRGSFVTFSIGSILLPPLDSTSSITILCRPFAFVCVCVRPFVHVLFLQYLWYASLDLHRLSLVVRVGTHTIVLCFVIQMSKVKFTA